MQDIFEAARNKIGPSLIHSFFNSEGSYSQGGKYYILSPIRGDRSVGSFTIEEDSGLWYDYATGEGGDFIDLVSLARGCDKKEAAEDIIRESGGVFVEPSKEPKKKDKKKVSSPLIPIPDTDEIKKSIKNRVQENWWKENRGEAESLTRYYNEDGDWFFVICRFVKESKVKGKKRQKNDILFYYGEDGKWWSNWHEDLKPFPPLGIEKIKDNKLPVIIVEGEKCGRVKVEGYNVISFYGGSSNVNKTNWNLLKGRDITIWPDADSEMDRNKEYYLPRELQPGIKAAHYIKSQLPKATILEIYKAMPIEDNPSGWDIADYVEAGSDPLKFINEFTPYYSVDVEIDSYQVYRKFIEMYYDNDNLEQAGGWFWDYSKDKHYWDKTNKNDISCNLQRWLEETGLQWIISKKVKVTKFVNEIKQYVDRHSMGYITENPFKESALSPYLHFKNGAVKMTKENTEWLNRDKYGDDYFKKLYPITCLDFNFDNESYKNIDPKKSCPAFYFFVKDMIPRNYMKNKSDAEKETAIDEAILFLSQIIAYALSPIKPNEYLFGIYGAQRTGKSFFIDILRSIIGKEFCVETPITNMEHRFASASLWGKKVYIEPDLKTRKSLPEDFIKTYSGDQNITVEEKNQPAISGVHTSIAMFFVSNYEFHAKGIEGLDRRFVIVPYKNKIEKHDTRLLDKIKGEFPHGKESMNCIGETFDERPGIASLAVKGWEVFCENNHMISIPEWAQTEKDNWLMESNSVVKFYEENYFSNKTKNIEQRSEVYEFFERWCKTEGRKPLGKKNFYEETRRDERITEIKQAGLDNFIINGKIEDEIPF